MNDVTIETLSANVGNLRTKDMAFATSLINQWARKGRLSEKQWPWVEKLAQYATSGYPKAEARPTTQEALGDFGGVYGLLQGASANLKYPKVRVRTSTDFDVALHIAGPRSKYAGKVMVTDGGKYPNNTFFGTIDGAGNWDRTRKAGDDVADVLRRLAQDPATVAAEYGKLTGRCCMCTRHLEDERSTQVGYGPVCAKNFSLPWGK